MMRPRPTWQEVQLHVSVEPAAKPRKSASHDVITRGQKLGSTVIHSRECAQCDKINSRLFFSELTQQNCMSLGQLRLQSVDVPVSLKEFSKKRPTPLVIVTMTWIGLINQTGGKVFLGSLNQLSWVWLSCCPKHFPEGLISIRRPSSPFGYVAL
jgi:hypothetical protein